MDHRAYLNIRLKALETIVVTRTRALARLNKGRNGSAQQIAADELADAIETLEQARRAVALAVKAEHLTHR